MKRMQEKRSFFARFVVLAQIVLYRIQAGLVSLYPPKANKTNDLATETDRANVAVQQKNNWQGTCCSATKQQGNCCSATQTNSRANVAVQQKCAASEMLQCSNEIETSEKENVAVQLVASGEKNKCNEKLQKL